jgi:poly(glycerol-phosphate) alpha-glucosyltransferase
MVEPWALRNNTWKKKLAFWAFETNNLRASSCLHALSDQEADTYRRLGLKNPIAIVPNGVNIPNISISIEAPKWVRHDQRNVLLFLGRIHPKKGLLQLINSWMILKRTNRLLAARWILVIAGWDDGGHQATLMRIVRENHLEHDVLFPGPLFGRDKERALRYARAFILPSFSEGLPVGVLEAWSFELPVLMTQFCNLPQGFDSGAAFKIETDSVSLSNSLSCVLTDEDALRVAGQRGKKLVERFFSWRVVAGQFVALYRWLVQGGSKPGFVE